MRKKRKYYDFYVRCMETELIPDVDNGVTNGGLCSIFPKKMALFMPDDDSGYWAYEGSVSASPFDIACKFTTLRQTIVLFLAAMNNEL